MSSVVVTIVIKEHIILFMSASTMMQIFYGFIFEKVYVHQKYGKQSDAPVELGLYIYIFSIYLVYIYICLLYIFLICNI